MELAKLENTALALFILTLCNSKWNVAIRLEERVDETHLILSSVISEEKNE